MGNKVQGKNIGGFMKVDGVYYPIFCGQTLRFRSPQGLIETTNVNSGSWRDYDPGMSTATMEISGITILNNTEGRISDAYLFQQSVKKVKQDWKITKTDDDGNILVYTFKGLIQDLGFDKSIGSYSHSDVSVQVCGPVTVDTVEPPNDSPEQVYSDWWTMPEGATSISGNSDVHGYSLIGKTVLEVDRSGLQHDLITSGSPGNRQAKHNSTTGAVAFLSTNPSGGETVFVLFKE